MVSTLYAQQQVFTRSFTYKPIDADDDISARASAMVGVRNLLINDACEYLRAQTKLVALCDNKYPTIMPAIVMNMLNIHVLDEKWHGATSITIRAQISIDPNIDVVSISKVLYDKSIVAEMLNIYRTIAQMETKLSAAHDALSGKNKRSKTSPRRHQVKSKKDVKAKVKNISNPLATYDDMSDYLTLVIPYLEGNVAYFNGFYGVALQCYSKMLVLDPENLIALNAIGMTYSRIGKVEQAIATFQKSLAINPSVKETYYDLGCAYNSQGYYAQSITNFERALRLDSTYVLAYIGISKSYFQQGNNSQAELMIQRALVIDPNNALSYVNLGNIYLQQMRLTEATGCFQRAIELNPNMAEAYNQLGVLYLQRKSYQNSVLTLKKAISLTQDPTQSYFTLSDAYMDMRKSRLAIGTLKKYIRSNPNNAEAYRRLSKIYEKKRKKKSAEKYYEIAEQIESASH